ncbi:hypothetical protein [Sporosarcina sp. FSL K6-3457]|uniref:hypothetical protein n=1 Tax=Sporosarcina sp. FSL K6-3457 TaxID=2978204 RepID=UPI0030F6FE72
MKNVMTKAWEIAKEGAAKFGGKAVEYFAEALRMAWAEVKTVNEKVEIVLAPGSRKHKSWLARIVGPHAKWKFDRVFLDSEMEDAKVFNVENGVYEACDGGDRYFIQVANGKYEVIQDWKAEQLIA